MIIGREGVEELDVILKINLAEQDRKVIAKAADDEIESLKKSGWGDVRVQEISGSENLKER